MTFRRAWGEVLAEIPRSRRFHWVDLLLVVGIAGLFLGTLDLAKQVTGELHETIAIDLNDPWVLIRFTFFSLCRGLVAYALSLAFTLAYGYWAAKDPVGERVLVPLLDILQSIPVLSFLPGLVLALVAIFPTRNIGLELATILMIFTGQVWNMTFSFYHSLKAVPQDQREVATLYRLNWWQRLRWVELPFSAIGLVWNSMMSMAGGWFFLTLCESFQLKGKDYRLPGIGSYVSVAVDEGNYGAMAAAFAAMVVMIVLLDQLLWRPVVVWAQKFRIEEGGGGGGPAMTSWFLTWVRRSRLVAYVTGRFRRKPAELPAAAVAPKLADTPLPTKPLAPSRLSVATSYALFGLMILLLLWGGVKLVKLILPITLAQWGETVLAAVYTLLRVLTATAIGTLWTVPAGLAIGLSPRLSRQLQPVMQVLASFPAPMLFPAVIAVLTFAGIRLDFGSIVLMLLGTQWYLLFNVTAGAMAIPADLREAARSFSVGGWLRFWKVHVPAIFPYLVTGWVTAAGGAWNASIVSEYVTFKKEPQIAHGIGAQIAQAANASEEQGYGLLAASTLVMALVVVTFNRTVWRYCYRLAETKFSLNK
ncbi:MAG: ABC transporter permease [Gemmataceae bacterium]